MTQDLRGRLLRAEDDFLHSILQGEKHLTSYSAFWATLESDFFLAVVQQEADTETIGLGHSVASHVDCIARCFLDINAKHEELYSDLEQILQGINGIQISDATPSQEHRGAPSLLQTTANSSSRDEDHEFYPPFLAPAYDWLLENLHNPYPSSDFKTSLARTSGCPVSAITSWFANARRRMGWTSICRDHFRNARSDAVDAASKILTKDGLHHTLSPELVHAFVAMKVNAEGLYASLFTRSALAGDLDSVVKNMSEVDKAPANDGKRLLTEEPSSSQKDDGDLYRGLSTSHSKELAAETSYPSPHRSHSSSPVPTLVSSLTDESDDEDDVSPPILAGRKRRSSSSSSEASTGCGSATRPIKRLRSNSRAPSACLPSPSTSTHYDSPKLALPAIPENYTNTICSRKRRLSNTDIDDTLKRPRGFIAPPRLHTVSDPLPRSSMDTEHSIDNWFNTNFDALFTLPPPVDAVEPDLSTQWEIELFNNYSIPQDLQKPQSKSLPPAIQDNPTSSPVDFAELENLLQSMSNSGYHQSTIPPDTSSPSKDFPLSSELSPSIEWTALLNNEEFLASSINSIYPHPSADSQPLSGIDLSILQLPDITPPVTLETASDELASKQAKLHQLQVMQEAVRRMERELQSEGITI